MSQTEPQPVGIDAQKVIDRLSRELSAALVRAVIAEEARDVLTARLDEAMAARLNGDA